MTLLHGYTAEGLEKQYNARMARPDFDSHVVPGWTRRSTAFRAAAECKLDLAYGASPRERLDFFPAANGANGPVLVFFHGGYWQRLDKSFFSFVAEPFVKNGVSVVLANYDLCPSVRISQIPPQARRAVAWVWRNAAELGYSKDRLYVTGHSAGGHITAMVMASDWRALGNDLPPDLVKGGIPISGLFELEPLRHTSINNALGMDQAEAFSQSPMNHCEGVSDLTLEDSRAKRPETQWRRGFPAFFTACLVLARNAAEWANSGLFCAVFGTGGSQDRTGFDAGM